MLITGAARGIGAALARALHARGARLTLIDLDAAALRELGAQLGERHVIAPADVTDSPGLELAVRASVEKFGGLDAAVANAGIASTGSVREMAPEAFARTVEVNLTGTFRTMHAVLPELIDSRGYFLVVSSLASMLPLPFGSAYGAGKAGAEALANALRIEVAEHGVGVGSAHMAVVDTDMAAEAKQVTGAFEAVQRLLPPPLNRDVSSEACAERFVRAIERRSRKVYVPAAAALADPLRLVFASPLGDWLAATLGERILADTEREVTKAGTALSERIGRLGTGGR